MNGSSTEQRFLWDRIAADYTPQDAVETDEISPMLDFLSGPAGSSANSRRAEFTAESVPSISVRTKPHNRPTG